MTFIKQSSRNYLACLALWKWTTMEHAGGSFRDSVECSILAGDVEMMIKQQPIGKQGTLRSLTQS